MRYEGKVVTSSENGLVLQTITNIEVTHEGVVEFDRIGLGEDGFSVEMQERCALPDHVLLGMFLEGRAFVVGAS